MRDRETQQELIHNQKVDPDQFQRINEYSKITGVEAAVREVFSDFIECCISSRLESIAARLHKA
jgi:hypothetical protein